ncbi:MAG: hypothetical protein PHC88_02960 [Terrimicrobiaceae bacterium]|nr:hypothetical protein [Terrimicrobiaceae bacterium]
MRTRDFLPKYTRLISLAERLIAFPPRRGVMGPAIAALGGKRTVKVTFLPVIPDAAVLADLVYRASWYLSPVFDKVKKVVFPVAPGVGAQDGSPAYMDEEVARCRGQIRDLLEFRESVTLDDIRSLVADADIVLVWDSKLWDPPARLSSYGVFRRGRRTFFNVDRQTYSREASTWLDVPRLLGSSRSSVVAECREKFAEMAAALGGGQRAYVFGTGPCLEEIAEMELLQGVRVVSNSLVRNERLMEKIRPSIVCCGDPVFHAGCSGYAAEFRRNLADAMQRHPLYAVVPITHYPYYRAHFPASLMKRIFGVPINKLGHFNFDLLSDYEVNQTGNILTMLMLPVASTLAREVCIGGCDGRSDKAQAYFWSHHAPSQIVDKMDAAKESHPGFFRISYTDYYDQHCETLELLMQEGEQAGHIFRNITTSHVPGLARRDFSDSGSRPADERPVVYTFCAPIHGKIPEHEAALVDLWRESWTANGWEAVVLDESSVAVDEEVARMLLAYRALPSINRKKLDYYCYVRWLAVAQAGGGFMCDYDVVNYGFRPRPVGKMALYERSVPCLVSGTAAEYERVARFFAAYSVASDDRLQGKPHVSDMMILTKNTWMFEQSQGCAEYGRPGWEAAGAVHFSNLSMKSRSHVPRHEHIPKLRPFPTAAAAA